jgi:hypothetical protein
MPANALDSPTWATRFEDERAVELARAAASTTSAAVPGGTAATSTTRTTSAGEGETMVGDGGGGAGGLRLGDDLEEFTGQSIIIGRFVNEDYRQITMDPRQVAVWSDRDHGANFVDLAGPSELPTPKEEKTDDDSWSFRQSSDEGDDGEDGNNLDFSAFDSRRR